MLIDPFLHYSQAPRNSLMCLGTGCGRACDIRHRDTMQQERVSIDRLHDLIDREVNMKNLFRKIMGQV